MATLLPVEDIIDIAIVSQYLASSDVRVGSIFRGANLDTLLPIKIYDIRKAVYWAYSQNYVAPDVDTQETWDEDLRALANYLYSLCGRYAIKAQGIITAGGGQIIYNPTTGQVLNGFVPVDGQFIVGEPDSPLDPTNTFFTINDTFIYAGSLDVHVDTGELPIDLTEVVSYEPTYSSTTINVVFNQELQPGQIVRFQYWKGISSSSGVAKVSQPTLYYTFTSDETEISFSELVGVPLTDLRLIFYNTTNVEPVAGATADTTQLQYDSTTGTLIPYTGGLFTIGNKLAIDYVK